MKNYKVAVIGCGAICGNHIKAILEAGHKICALCDIIPERAKAQVEKYKLGSVAIYTDYMKMLHEQLPDSVHICTPHYLHAEMVISALEKNINVLCEKPLCISYEQMEKIKSALAVSTSQLGVCHQNRYEKNMLKLRELADCDIRSAMGFVCWKRDASYYATAAWRGTVAEEGGGVMINQALHTLDLLQWICGMPEYVTAHIFNDSLHRVIEVEDTATARFETKDGKILIFFATNGSGTDFPPRLEIRLEDGEIATATNPLLTVGQKIIADEEEQFVGKSVWGTGHAKLISDFYHCLDEGRHFPIDFEEGSKVIRLILAMYESNGKRIAIK